MTNMMSLPEIIVVMAPLIYLQEGSPINRYNLLNAIAEVESEGGLRNCAGKMEPGMVEAVMKAHPKHYIKFGDKLATSFGAFQVLGTVAYELGHKGDPNDMCNDVVGAFWAIQYINRRILFRDSHKHLFEDGVPLEDQIKSIGDAYNSGSAVDRHEPKRYMRDLWKAYQDA